MLQKKNGMKVDKKQNEKITDFVRKIFEKFTGYVPSIVYHGPPTTT